MPFRDLWKYDLRQHVHCLMRRRSEILFYSLKKCFHNDEMNNKSTWGLSEGTQSQKKGTEFSKGCYLMAMEEYLSG